MALYVEKPQHKYLLRGLQVLYIATNVTEDSPIYADIYAVSKDEDDMLVLGDLLYKTKGVLPAKEGQSYGFISLPIVEEEDGLEFEVSATIDQEIAVVVYGYEQANAATFTMLISADNVDEGYGQHGYMLHVDEEGIPTHQFNLADFFNGVSFKCTAPTVFLDVEYPFLSPMFSEEDGVKYEYQFPSAGGDFNMEVPAEDGGTTTINFLPFVSAKSSEEWSILTTDGEDIPEWLSINPVDQFVKNEETQEDVYSSTVYTYITAQPLPEDVEYRECKVEFAVPGESVVYTFYQGTKPSHIGDVNQDGVVNVSDVTALINKILNIAEYDDAICDINGDGVVNVSDVTALINIVLN